MTNLKVGDKAPPFETIDQNENSIKLSDYKGKKVALFFYPKDNTPGCTAEACNLRDNEKALESQGIQVMGVSPDNLASHKKFAEKYDITYPLLVDKDKTIINAYGVWGPKKFMGKEFEGVHRTTFIIDEKGKIQEIISKVKTKDHAAQITEVLG